jgi:hypothetical protein
MAQLNEAFNTYKQPKKCFMDELIKKIPTNEPSEIMYSKNSINNQFMDINNAFDRVKMSNTKYDDIIRTNKSVYGYICQVCNGCMSYHLYVQNKDPHDFIKGEYRALSQQEQIPYYEEF